MTLLQHWNLHHQTSVFRYVESLVKFGNVFKRYYYSPNEVGSVDKGVVKLHVGGVYGPTTIHYGMSTFRLSWQINTFNRGFQGAF